MRRATLLDANMQEGSVQSVAVFLDGDAVRSEHEAKAKARPVGHLSSEQDTLKVRVRGDQMECLSLVRYCSGRGWHCPFTAFSSASVAGASEPCGQHESCSSGSSSAIQVCTLPEYVDEYGGRFARNYIVHGKG